MTGTHLHKAKVFTAIVLISFALLVLISPQHAHFRDSAEFILSAIFLDISHPPGSPFYTQSAHVLSFIPFGPLAWRVHIFSALVAAFCLGSLWWLSYTLLALRSRRQRLNLSFTASIAPIVLISTHSFYTSAFTAEVYGLLTLFFILLTSLIVKFERSLDARWLYTACFVAGLAAGTHAAIVPLVIWACLCLVIGRWRQIKHLLLGGMGFVWIGLLVYSYLPARTSENLPLNTGAPSSIERLINHLTNARDRNLRATPVDVDTTSFHSFSSAVVRDLERMSQEIPAPLLCIGMFGLVLLFRKSIRLSALLLGSFIIYWYFFAGWQSEPWILLFCILALGAAQAAHALVERIESATLARALPILLVLPLMLTSLYQLNLEKIAFFPTYEVPTSEASQILDGLPPRAVLVSEPSWFILSYTQAVEGYRNDVTVLYQPEILFPIYFAPFTHVRYDHEHFASDADSDLEPFKRLGNFLAFATASNKFFFEPTPVLNGYLSGVARCADNGLFRLIPGASSQIDQACVPYVTQALIDLRAASFPEYPLFVLDNRNYFEVRLNGAADLFSRSSHPELASQLLNENCSPSSHSACSELSIANLSAYLIEEERYLDATVVLSEYLLANPASRPIIQPRLKEAFYRLSTEEKRQFLRQNPEFDFQSL